jgi:hypothetical protein
MDKDIILAFPRSGSHLFRFMFEILSEQGTIDFTGNCIYTNEFTDFVDFNVNPEDKTWNKHLNALDHHDIDNLIVIIRKPREVITRQSMYMKPKDIMLPLSINRYKVNVERYFKILDYYIDFEGNKILFYYEDMIKNPETFIRDLYSFLGNGKAEKLNYILDNYDKLFNICAECDYEQWGGVISNTDDYWFSKLSDDDKKTVEDILNPYLNNNRYASFKL